MSSNFTLSLELIYLLDWLLKHEQNRLRAIIKRAVQMGLMQKISGAHSLKIEDSLATEDLQHSFVEFMNFLEETLAKTLNTLHEGRQLQFDLATLYKELNIDNVDGHTALAILQEAQHELAHCAKNEDAASSSELKKALLTKVLKNWKPQRHDLEH